MSELTEDIENFEGKFRKVDLTIERVQQLKSKYEANVKALQDKMTNLKFVSKQMNKYSLVAHLTSH